MEPIENLRNCVEQVRCGVDDANQFVDLCVELKPGHGATLLIAQFPLRDICVLNPVQWLAFSYTVADSYNTCIQADRLENNCHGIFRI